MKKTWLIICYLFLSIPIYLQESNFNKQIQIYVSENTENITLNSVSKLKCTHWIKKTPFEKNENKEIFDSEINYEFIFLKGNRVLIFNNMWSYIYDITTNTYKINTTFVSIYNELDYKIISENEIECSSFCRMILINNELHVVYTYSGIEEIYVLADVFPGFSM